MKIIFTLRGEQNVVEVYSEDLKDLVYKAEHKVLETASQKGLQLPESQKRYLLSLICEVFYRDIYSEEICLGELCEVTDNDEK